MLDDHSPLPLYYQLRDLLEKQIDSGFFKPGEKIPSENELCKKYNISRTTVRQAIADLVNMNKLVRSQGLGTFVSEARIVSRIHKLNGFSQDMMNQGLKPFSKILELAPILPSKEIANKLQIQDNEAVVFIKRLQFAENKVIGLYNNNYPFSRFNGLLDEDLANNSMYDLLINKYDTIPSSSYYRIEMIKCPREISVLLQIPVLEPVLHLSEIVYDQNEMVFEYNEEYYRGDRYSFNIVVRKDKDETLHGVHKIKDKLE